MCVKYKRRTRVVTEPKFYCKCYRTATCWNAGSSIQQLQQRREKREERRLQYECYELKVSSQKGSWLGLENTKHRRGTCSCSPFGPLVTKAIVRLRHYDWFASTSKSHLLPEWRMLELRTTTVSAEQKRKALLRRFELRPSDRSWSSGRESQDLLAYPTLSRCWTLRLQCLNLLCYSGWPAYTHRQCQKRTVKRSRLWPTRNSLERCIARRHCFAGQLALATVVDSGRTWVASSHHAEHFGSKCLMKQL